MWQIFEEKVQIKLWVHFDAHKVMYNTYFILIKLDIFSIEFRNVRKTFPEILLNIKTNKMFKLVIIFSQIDNVDRKEIENFTSNIIFIYRFSIVEF